MIRTRRRRLLALAGAALLPFRAHALTALRIGVLTDLRPQFAAAMGTGAIEAVRLAAEEIGVSGAGRPVEVLSADHRGDASLAATQATQWFDAGVEAIVEVTGGEPALAVQRICRDRGKIALFTGPGSRGLTSTACSTTGFQWTEDSYSVVRTMGLGALEAGASSWVILAAPDPASEAAAGDLARVVQDNARVLSQGPLTAAGLAAARAAGPRVVALCGPSDITAPLIDRPAGAGPVLVSSGLTITDIARIGLANAQGMLIAEPFVWDADETSRAWSRRYMERTGAMPGPFQIGAYEATRHYLQSYGASASGDGIDVARRMRYAPIESPFTHGARIRADGRVLRAMRLERVKIAPDSRGAWDLLATVKIMPSEALVWPSTESTCKLLQG